MKISLFTFIIICLQTNVTSANNYTVKLTLQDTVSQALKNSYNAKTVNAEVWALKNKAEVQHSLLLPKVTLEGNYKYITEVPTLKFPTGASTAFGDNQNYSIGPVLNWIIWDFDALKNSVNGILALEKSKIAEKDLINRQIILNARLAYFKIQLRIEQQRLVADSLKLVESQHHDIQNRVKAGASNRIDLLSAHKEVLNLKLQARQIQADLAADIRDLYALLGQNESIDFPIEIIVDPISQTLNALFPYENKTINANDLEQNPIIKMHTANAESANLSAKSFKANQLPKLALLLKTSMDYPNGPILEKFNQNTIGLTLTMPLFEGGRSSNEAAEKQHLAIASENRREQARNDIIRDANKAHEQLKGLREKIDIYKNLVTESEERAKLVYSSFRVGRSSFLEVQSANLQALEAKVQATSNDVQILIQTALLASISEEQ